MVDLSLSPEVTDSWLSLPQARRPPSTRAPHAWRGAQLHFPRQRWFPLHSSCSKPTFGPFCIFWSMFSRGPCRSFGQVFQKGDGFREDQGQFLGAAQFFGARANRTARKIWLWSKPFWDPIFVGIGEFTTHFRTHFRTHFSGDGDVHWGCGVLTHSHMSVPHFFSELGPTAGLSSCVCFLFFQGAIL